MVLRSFHLILLLVWTLGSAFAIDVHLFDQRREQVAEYNQLLRDLKSSDVLVFPNGKRFIVHESLGKGNTSRVVRVTIPGEVPPKSYALRIPISTGLMNRKIPFTKYITSTIVGYNELKGSQLPIVPVLDSARNQYVLTEVIPHRINGLQFLRFLDSPSYAAKFGMGAEELVQIRGAMDRFASLTSEFSNIGDFRPDQLVFNDATKEWILLDWTSGAKRVEKVGDLGKTGVFGELFKSGIPVGPKANAYIDNLRKIARQGLPRRSCFSILLQTQVH